MHHGFKNGDKQHFANVGIKKKVQRVYLLPYTSYFRTFCIFHFVKSFFNFYLMMFSLNLKPYVACRNVQ